MLVILESPFRGEFERNIRYARRAVKDSLLRGESPIASHLLYTQPGVLDDNNPQEREHGIRAGLDWLRRADKMVVYEDFGLSPGMQNAIRTAAIIGIHVEYRVIGQNG